MWLTGRFVEGRITHYLKFSVKITTNQLHYYFRKKVPYLEIEISIGIIDIAALIYSLLFFVSLVLLFRFKPSGRTMFTILLIVGIPLSLGMSESSIPTGSLYQTYVWFGGLLEGAMLAILYLTSIKERFQKIEE